MAPWDRNKMHILMRKLYCYCVESMKKWRWHRRISEARTRREQGPDSVSADSNLVPKGGTVTLVARSRLFWWLFGWMGLLLFALSGGLGFLLLEQMERFEFQQVEENLHFQATQVERELLQLSPNGVDLSPQTVADQYRNTPLRLTILDGEGRVLADSAVTPPPAENHSDRPEIVAAQAQSEALPSFTSAEPLTVPRWSMSLTESSEPRRPSPLFVSLGPWTAFRRS